MPASPLVALDHAVARLPAPRTVRNSKPPTPTRSCSASRSSRRRGERDSSRYEGPPRKPELEPDDTAAPTKAEPSGLAVSGQWRVPLRVSRWPEQHSAVGLSGGDEAGVLVRALGRHRPAARFAGARGEGRVDLLLKTAVSRWVPRHGFGRGRVSEIARPGSTPGRRDVRTTPRASLLTICLQRVAGLVVGPAVGDDAYALGLAALLLSAGSVADPVGRSIVFAEGSRSSRKVRCSAVSPRARRPCRWRGIVFVAMMFSC